MSHKPITSTYHAHDTYRPAIGDGALGALRESAHRLAAEQTINLYSESPSEDDNGGMWGIWASRGDGDDDLIGAAVYEFNVWAEALQTLIEWTVCTKPRYTVDDDPLSECALAELIVENREAGWDSREILAIARLAVGDCVPFGIGGGWTDVRRIA